MCHMLVGHSVAALLNPSSARHPSLPVLVSPNPSSTYSGTRLLCQALLSRVASRHSKQMRWSLLKIYVTEIPQMTVAFPMHANPKGEYSTTERYCSGTMWFRPDELFTAKAQLHVSASVFDVSSEV